MECARESESENGIDGGKEWRNKGTEGTKERICLICSMRISDRRKEERKEDRKASVLMLRLSYPTETVVSD